MPCNYVHILTTVLHYICTQEFDYKHNQILSKQLKSQSYKSLFSSFLCKVSAVGHAAMLAAIKKYIPGLVTYITLPFFSFKKKKKNSFGNLQLRFP